MNGDVLTLLLPLLNLVDKKATRHEPTQNSKSVPSFIRKPGMPQLLCSIIYSGYRQEHVLGTTLGLRAGNGLTTSLSVLKKVNRLCPMEVGAGRQMWATKVHLVG